MVMANAIGMSLSPARTAWSFTPRGSAVVFSSSDDELAPPRSGRRPRIIDFSDEDEGGYRGDAQGGLTEPKHDTDDGAAPHFGALAATGASEDSTCRSLSRQLRRGVVFDDSDDEDDAGARGTTTTPQVPTSRRAPRRAVPASPSLDCSSSDASQAATPARLMVSARSGRRVLDSSPSSDEATPLGGRVRRTVIQLSDDSDEDDGDIRSGSGYAASADVTPAKGVHRAAGTPQQRKRAVGEGNDIENPIELVGSDSGSDSDADSNIESDGHSFDACSPINALWPQHSPISAGWPQQPGTRRPRARQHPRAAPSTPISVAGNPISVTGTPKPAVTPAARAIPAASSSVAPPISAKGRAAAKRDLLASVPALFARLNAQAFDTQLPGDLTIKWSNTLRRTAGITKFHSERRLVGSVEPARRLVTIELASKVLDTPERLESTLLHELCHAAAWLLDGQSRPPHGPHFWRWANRAMAKLPASSVTTCHAYEIHCRFRFECTDCSQVYGRHSKSIDLVKQRCGRCRGVLRFVGAFEQDGTPVKARQPTAFAGYVKTHFAAAKKGAGAGAAHAEVMALLSEQWRAHKEGGESPKNVKSSEQWREGGESSALTSLRDVAGAGGGPARRPSARGRVQMDAADVIDLEDDESDEASRSSPSPPPPPCSVTQLTDGLGAQIDSMFNEMRI
mmetsp:Transcript_34092/g.80342  ORF Transcript_34092/g.80342 Transcript_34092/m.80342 type:complete len:680 (+) Transcript_34092:17-2056(+)